VVAVAAGATAQVGTTETAKSSARVVQAFMRFLGDLASIPSVRRIAYWAEGDALEIWVLLREDVPEDAERIFLMEHDFATSPAGFPFDLHLAALSDVDEANLPSMLTLIDRG
jgi:hypothetical protein